MEFDVLREVHRYARAEKRIAYAIWPSLDVKQRKLMQKLMDNYGDLGNFSVKAVANKSFEDATKVNLN